MRIKFTVRPSVLFQVGAAALVHGSGKMILTSSVFRFNAFAHDSSTDTTTGIKNLGGQIKCALVECLPVCTVCEIVSSRVPTASPVPSPTPQPGRLRYPQPATHLEATTATAFAIAVCSVLLFLGCCMAVVKQKYGLCKFRDVDSEEDTECRSQHLSVPFVTDVEYNPSRWSEDATSDSTRPSNSSASIELALRSSEGSEDAARSRFSLPQSVMENSPSPILVVRRDMRITIWSTGMSIAAPLHFSPVGRPVSDLPFRVQAVGHRVQEHLRRIITGSGTHGSKQAQTVMLNLDTKTGPCLLEMIANVLDTEAGPAILMTGREVETGLAGLIGYESAVSGEENNVSEERKILHLPSETHSYHSETERDDGDDTGHDDDGDDRDRDDDDKISELSMPTVFRASGKGDLVPLSRRDGKLLRPRPFLSIALCNHKEAAGSETTVRERVDFNDAPSSSRGETDGSEGIARAATFPGATTELDGRSLDKPASPAWVMELARVESSVSS